jgi:hypothetical protein
MKKLVASMALLALIGAGCPSVPTPASNSTQTQTKPAQVQSQMGFGKLPSLATASGQPAALDAHGSNTLNAAPAPMMAGGNVATTQNSASVGMMAPTPSSAPVATDMMKIRPIPVPPNLKPVAIKYNITATVPEWSAESDVLQVQPRNIVGVPELQTFLAGAGLSATILAGVKSVQSIQVSWTDVDGYVWNTDGNSGMLNWWKNQNTVQPMMPTQGDQQPPIKQDDAKIIAAADTFLRGHGLGAVADQGATVEQFNQPCMYNEKMMAPDAASGAGVSGSATVSAGGGATSMIYPSPCGYYQQQASVFYGANREGEPVVDMGGWPSRMSSVTVDLNSLTVTGGNVVYAENISRSAYPLLDKATVMQRLQTGGRNPVYPWGGETKDVVVTIDKVELAWLRFDSWADNQQQTYYIPAIAASGHVDRGIKGQEPEEYHTTVALVKDDAFADVGPQPYPVPMPMMQGGSGGGIAPPSAPVKY